MNNNEPITTNPALEIDFVRLLFACLRRWWVFVIVCSLTTAAAIVYSLFCLTPLYDSSISLYVNNHMNRSASEYVSANDMAASRSLVTTYIAISKSDNVMSAVAKTLGAPCTPEYLKSVVRVRQENETELIIATVRTDDPERSAQIANALATVLPAELSRIVEGSSAKIIDSGKVPTKKSFPSNRKNALVGMLIGVVVSAIFVFIKFITDVRILDADDLKELCEYPLLGRIPRFDQLGKRSGREEGYDYVQMEGKEQPVENKQES